MQKPAFIKRAAALTLTLLLAACHSYMDVERAGELAQLPELRSQLTDREGFTSEAPVQQWWTQLQDARLDALIRAALEHNHDIRRARSSLDGSRAALDQARANRLPTLDAAVGMQRDKQPTAVNPLRPSAIMETYQAGFDTAWEVDLYAGRLGAAVQQGLALQTQQETELQAMRVSIAAEVAGAYISLRGSQYLLDVAQRNAGVQQQTYQVTQTLDEVGQGNRLDVSRARAQLALTEARIPALQAEVQVALNRLGVLTGRGRDALAAELEQRQSLPSVPSSVAVGNPQQLLARRPDIRGAEAELRAAVAQYNIAVSDLYPRIVFTGSLGYLSRDWSDLGESSSEVFSFAPRLQWGGLNQGRAQARIAVADADVQGQIAGFEQRVLLALEETDNALQRFSREEERRSKLLEAAQSNALAAQYARQTFEIGNGNFLDVLDAQRSQLETDAQLAESETRLLLNLIEVYRALGGGWQTQQ